jgi:hypothetical protein
VGGSSSAVIWASVNCCLRITHAFPVFLRPADQPIQARKSIRVVRLRPKVRQTAALLVLLYRERRATGQGKP